MPENIIEVENISKLYKLGSVGTGTISHDLNRWWNTIRKKEDPYFGMARKNSRSGVGQSDYVWSLKDINFNVKQGEVFGIVGGNGAGKSTLLKILSKITKPTTGMIRMGGRVASLLEVGTGFHPELTGRENVYLNGAILGMRRQEIRNKFDEIVAFSEIGGYIDTPVKKYSSGMYVRLAFAVAAHLEPDILIIDEVLAVGDASFQVKCLGKMEDVSQNQGRTVLFVSHNISAIRQLCSKALLLEHGTQRMTGDIKDVLSLYKRDEPGKATGKRTVYPDNTSAYFTDWHLEVPYSEPRHSCVSGDSCVFSFGLCAMENLKNGEVRLFIRYDGMLLVSVSSMDNGGKPFSISQGMYRFKFNIDLPLTAADFDVEAVIISSGKEVDFWKSPTRLTVIDNYISQKNEGLLNIKSQFSVLEEVQAVNA